MLESLRDKNKRLARQARGLCELQKRFDALQLKNQELLEVLGQDKASLVEDVVTSRVLLQEIMQQGDPESLYAFVQSLQR